MPGLGPASGRGGPGWP